MKDFLEYFFHVDSGEEITLRTLLIIALKIIIFLLVLSGILWVLLKK